MQPEPRAVYVHWQGEWYEGFALRWWQGQDDEWRVYAEWTVGVGETHRATVAADQVKPRGTGPEAGPARFSTN